MKRLTTAAGSSDRLPGVRLERGMDAGVLSRPLGFDATWPSRHPAVRKLLAVVILCSIRTLATRLVHRATGNESQPNEADDCQKTIGRSNRWPVTVMSKINAPQ